MKTLTLQQIAGYLPFGLQGTFQLKDVISTATEEVRNKALTDNSLPFFIAYCKPLLHPLSSLTKTINGICPLVELANIAIPHLLWHEDNIIYDTIHNSAIDKFWFRYDVDNGGFHLTYSGRTRQVPNQHALFQKLYELHIDFQGLIEEGLAIEITNQL